MMDGTLIDGMSMIGSAGKHQARDPAGERVSESVKLRLDVMPFIFLYLLFSSPARRTDEGGGEEMHS